MIVTYHGDVETTSFFMTQMEKGLRADGYEVCPLSFQEDVDAWVQGKEEKLRDAIFLTFNFAGIYSKDACRVRFPDSKSLQTKEPDKNAFREANREEDKQDDRQVMLVDRYMMRCINILVDHPYHYHDFLYEQMRFRSGRYLQFCIDKQHLAYMETYFPEISLGGFLPSGGSGCEESGTDAHFPAKGPAAGERQIDILFPATYVEPAFFDVFIDRNGPEYSAFYHSIIDEALSDPEAKLEDIVKRRMEEEIEEGFTWEELRFTLGHIQFLDYTIRYQRRAKVVRAIVDGQEPLQLTILGSGWENFVKSLKHPERVRLLPYADSREVLRLMTESKMVLNVLPAFHEGAHDRIFNAMLCGAVCVTDSNSYLDEMLTDGKNAILYEHPAKENPDGEIRSVGTSGLQGELLSKRLFALLEPEDRQTLDRIAAAGGRLAAAHTWRGRVVFIERAITGQEADACRQT